MAVLTDISGIGNATASSLTDNGIDSVVLLANATDEQIEEFNIDVSWITQAQALITPDEDQEELELEGTNEEIQEEVGTVQESSDDPQEWSFTFDLGLFEGRNFFYREGNPAFTQGSGNMLAASLVTLEEINDDTVEGQKFKFFYSGEWSSAVMPEDEYQALKIALLQVANNSTQAPVINNGNSFTTSGTVAASSKAYAPAKTARRKGGCRTCGG